jgi:hypothetical protein
MIQARKASNIEPWVNDIAMPEQASAMTAQVTKSSD